MPFEKTNKKLESKAAVFASKLDFESHNQKKVAITSDFYNPFTPNNLYQMGFEAADCDPCESTYLSNDFKLTPSPSEDETLQFREPT